MAEAVGVAEVVAALSVTSDLTRGHPPGEAMRATLVATALAAEMGVDDVRRGDVYWATLLRFAGCTASSHDMALTVGDDVAVRARADLVDTTRPREALGFVAFLLGNAEPGSRLRIAAGLPRMPAVRNAGLRADCEVGAALAGPLRLPPEVSLAIRDGYERWDGHGGPAGRRGTAIAEPARVAAVAYTAVMFDAVGGAAAARDAVSRWSGRALDPDVAATFLDHAGDLLDAGRARDVDTAVVAAEPSPRRTFSATGSLDAALAAYGDACDLKTPWFAGHSRGVAELARAAATALGLADTTRIFRAAVLHDIGRVAVPSIVWERAGPLSREDWEAVRLHPYHTERVLARSPVLAGLARVAGRHHERLDGSGYPAHVGASEIDAACAVVGAADVVHALGEARPHRAAQTSADVATITSAMPLDRDALRAVLEAAGAAAPPRADLPAGLTEREVAVVRLLVAGMSERAAAASLGVAPSTVHTHTRHVYEKCAVSTRAGLAMFAMQHGLLRRPLP